MMATAPQAGLVLPFPATPRMPAVARILARYDREKLEAFISVAIDLLDALDPNPDVELNGDELDGSMGEDDFNKQRASGPGCPLADPDMSVDDQACDEPYQDLEPEENAVPIFGVDQTRWLIGPNGQPECQ